MDLIEPIAVEIEQIDKDATQYSTGPSGRREPVNQVKRKAKITMEAQVVFGDRDQRGIATNLGTDEQVKGYILVRYSDLQAQGVTLQRGDRIVKLGQLPQELYLMHSQGDPAAHFTGIAGFTLVKFHFMDRKPVGESRA